MSRSNSKSEEKLKAALNQIVLDLLKEDDNKFCADCEAKGPRWASWNLGIFVCIRCAGLHRNLGTHISKVKSVNLDSWTEDQVSVMVQGGNAKARAGYEALLPDHFRRPNSDSGMDQLIKAKYQDRKYFDRSFVPPTANAALIRDQLATILGGGTPKPRAQLGGVKLPPPSAQASIKTQPKSRPPIDPDAPVAKPVAQPQPKSLIDMDDFFGGPTSTPAPTSSSTTNTPSTVNPSPSKPNNTGISDDLAFLSDPAPASSSGNFGSSNPATTQSGNPPTSVKDSIMSLYASSANQPSFPMYQMNSHQQQQPNQQAGYQQQQQQSFNAQFGNMSMTNQPGGQHQSSFPSQPPSYSQFSGQQQAFPQQGAFPHQQAQMSNFGQFNMQPSSGFNAAGGSSQMFGMQGQQSGMQGGMPQQSVNRSMAPPATSSSANTNALNDLLF